jgi:hypothetical protein
VSRARGRLAVRSISMAGLPELDLCSGVDADVGRSLRAAQAFPHLVGSQTNSMEVLDVVVVCVGPLVASQPYTVAQVDST